ncbi:hypothetical protein ACE6H2_010440 [Prunus campanulata]
MAPSMISAFRLISRFLPLGMAKAAVEDLPRGRGCSHNTTEQTLLRYHTNSVLEKLCLDFVECGYSFFHTYPLFW